MTLGTLSYASPQGPPSLEHNRRAWLIAFGVVSILLGVISGLIAIVTCSVLITEINSPKTKTDLPELFLGIGTYAFFGVGFISLGAGSIRCRRWVRPAVLAFGAVIIAGSLLKFTAIAAAAWEKAHSWSVHGDIRPTSHIANVDFAAGVFGFLIVLAAIYLRFYATTAVRQTLQAYDVNASWCEQCPLPVLTAAAGLFFAGTGVILLASDARPPFGGARLSGAPSVTIKLLYGIILLVSAALVYRMKIQGCRLATFTLFAGFAANLISRFTEGTGEMTAISQGMMGPASATPQLPTPNLTVILAGVLCVGYMLWVHRFFQRSLPVFQ